MKPKILIASKIHDDAIAEAEKFADVDLITGLSQEDLVGKIKGYAAIIIRSKPNVTAEVIKASSLKVIGRAGVGLDNVDLEAAKENGIEVVNSPEASTISVAEHVFGLMLAIVRKIPHGDRHVREGKWERKNFIGNELYGKTIGIIGFGRIGREVAQRAYAFGMIILAYDPVITHEDARENNAKLAELDELLKNSDIVTLHVPLTDSTRGLINAEKFKLMKDSAIIINTARGPVIDEKALIKALKDGQISGAALDVYENEPPEGSELLKLENVVLVPHIAASTDEAQKNAGMVVVDKIKNILVK